MSSFRCRLPLPVRGPSTLKRIHHPLPRSDCVPKSPLAIITIAGPRPQVPARKDDMQTLPAQRPYDSIQTIKCDLCQCTSKLGCIVVREHLQARRKRVVIVQHNEHVLANSFSRDIGESKQRLTQTTLAMASAGKPWNSTSSKQGKAERMVTMSSPLRRYPPRLSASRRMRCAFHGASARRNLENVDRFLGPRSTYTVSRDRYRMRASTIGNLEDRTLRSWDSTFLLGSSPGLDSMLEGVIITPARRKTSRMIGTAEADTSIRRYRSLSVARRISARSGMARISPTFPHEQ